MRQRVLALGVMALAATATGCGEQGRSAQWPPEPPRGGCRAERLAISDFEWVEVSSHRGVDCATANRVAQDLEQVLMPRLQSRGISNGDTFRLRGFTVVARIPHDDGLSWRARRGAAVVTWHVFARID